VTPHDSLLDCEQERLVDKLRTLFAVFWTLIGVLVLDAVLAAFLYQFGLSSARQASGDDHPSYRSSTGCGTLKSYHALVTCSMIISWLARRLSWRWAR
jgi:ABC-type Fe3+ transport system permease subunit